MSDPIKADECKKLLDNGWSILLYRNQLGSYSAIANHGTEPIDLSEVEERHITDDFMPSEALYRLTEKVYGNIV